MSDYTYQIHLDQDIRPLKNDILVYGMESGERVSAGGIIIQDDNGKDTGIRPRRCWVYAVGSDVNNVSVGQEILVSHGRWSRGIKVSKSNGESLVIRKIDPKDILLVWNNSN